MIENRISNLCKSGNIYPQKEAVMPPIKVIQSNITCPYCTQLLTHRMAQYLTNICNSARHLMFIIKVLAYFMVMEKEQYTYQYYVLCITWNTYNFTYHVPFILIGKTVRQQYSICTNITTQLHKYSHRSITPQQNQVYEISYPQHSTNIFNRSLKSQCDEHIVLAVARL